MKQSVETSLMDKERTEEKFKEMHRISVSIEKNLMLLPPNINQNYYKKYMAVEELKKYRSGDEFYYDIAYYIRGDDIIYTSSYPFSIEAFINSVYKFSNWIMMISTMT